MSTTLLYPPSPPDVPADFTRPSAAYRWRVTALLASLFFFLLLYLALVVGAALFTWWIATFPLGKRGEWNPFVNGAGAAAGFLLFLWLFKGLFKSQKADRNLHVEVTAEEQPELFAFIHRLCDEA